LAIGDWRLAIADLATLQQPAASRQPPAASRHFSVLGSQLPFSTVIFDCDSTLSAIEGINELAVDHRAEIEALTEAAMRGELALEEVYRRRLDAIRPTLARLDALGQQYIQHVIPGARDVCEELTERGIEVRIVSGGLRPAVLHLAQFLGVPDDRVAAVDIYFDASGNYAGYDVSSPLARSGGKLAILNNWMPQLARPIMMVGDGSTDVEAKPAVDLFVAFAGVTARQIVIDAADVVIREASLLPVLEIAKGN
jgi:phosphoserine phosphatase